MEQADNVGQSEMAAMTKEMFGGLFLVIKPCNQVYLKIEQ